MGECFSVQVRLQRPRHAVHQLLEERPPLDPELLRFTPPHDGELGGAEPLWRSKTSLIKYLRLAILEGGGPGGGGGT